MTHTTRAPADPAPAPPSPDAPSRLDALDDRLVTIRRVLLRPGYRRRLLQGLPDDLELGVMRLLRVVQRAEGAPTIGEVAEVLTIDPSTASRVVDRAVSSGHLERRACADDRRRARLHLTPAGEHLLDQVSSRRRALLAEVTQDWDGRDLATLVDLLDRLLEGFDTLEGPA